MNSTTANSCLKYQYAAELLYLLAIMLWKWSNGLSHAQVLALANDRRRLQWTTLTTVIALVFLGALFAAAFQCDGPEHWAIREKAGSQCFNRVSDAIQPIGRLLIGFEQPAFWAAVGGVDILSDIILHSLLAVTIFRSQLKPVLKRSALTIVGLYLAA